MAKKTAKATSLQAIEDSLTVDGTAFYSAFRQKNPDEHVYAFLFELSAVGYAANAAIATQESLSRFAEECVDSYDGDLDRATEDLRWSSPENGWYQSPDKAFRDTNKLLDIAERSELYGEYDGSLEKLALRALKRMIKSGVFGDSSDLERGYATQVATIRMSSSWNGRVLSTRHWCSRGSWQSSKSERDRVLHRQRRPAHRPHSFPVLLTWR